MLALVLIIAKWLGLLGMLAAGGLALALGNPPPPLLHYLLGMLSTFVMAAAQTMTIYYFLGMSRAVLRAAERHGLPDNVRAEAISLKKLVSGRGYLVLLLATATLIAGGGTLFGRFPGWIHITLACVTLLGGIYTAFIEFLGFRLNAAFYDRAAELIGTDAP